MARLFHSSLTVPKIFLLFQSTSACVASWSFKLLHWLKSESYRAKPDRPVTQWFGLIKVSLWQIFIGQKYFLLSLPNINLILELRIVVIFTLNAILTITTSMPVAEMALSLLSLVEPLNTLCLVICPNASAFLPLLEGLKAKKGLPLVTDKFKTNPVILSTIFYGIDKQSVTNLQPQFFVLNCCSKRI